MASARLKEVLGTYTKEKGIQLQDDLIAAYSEESFQKRLREKWKQAGGDQVKQLKFRQELIVEVAGPIVAKYGFENSRRGINDSKLANNYVPWGQDADANEKFERLSYLLDPDISASVSYKAASPYSNANANKGAVAFLGGKKSKLTKAMDQVTRGGPDKNEKEKPGLDKKEKDKKGKFQPHVPLSKEKAAALQMDLIAGFNTDEFRSRLLVTYKSSALEPEAMRAYKIRQVCFEVQGPVMEKYGFERSFLGVLDSVQTINYHEETDESFIRRSMFLLYLINPEMQMKYADRQLSTLKVVSEDMKPLCTLEFDVAATFRYAKERIQGVTRIPWQAQKLNLITPSDIGFLESLGMNEDTQANTGESATAFQPPARAVQQTAAATDDDDDDDLDGLFGPVAEEKKQEQPVAAEKKQEQPVLKASPLSESIGELHDWELVSETIPIGRSAEIVLVQRSTTVLERLKQLCALAPKAKKGKAKKMQTKQEMLESMEDIVRSFPTEVLSDLDFVIPAMQLSSFAIMAVLKAAPFEICANRKVISTAIGLWGQALQFASSELQDDLQLVRAAVDNDGWNLQFASERLRANRELVAAAVESDGWAFQYAASDLQKDIELATAAVGKCGWLVTSLDPELQSNIAVVKKAVSKDPAVLADLSPCMRANREVVLEAVCRNGLVLEHAEEDLQSDREIVLVAVKNCGMALRFAHPQMKGVRDVAIAAVKRDGGALMFLEKWLQQDLEVLLAAVKQDFSMIKSIHGDLKKKVCAELGIDAENIASFEEAAAKAAKARAEAAEVEAAAEKNEIQDHLDTLGLPAGTTDARTIKQQYRRLALTHHPDKNREDPEGAKNRMVSINYAYDSLVRLMSL